MLQTKKVRNRPKTILCPHTRGGVINGEASEASQLAYCRGLRLPGIILPSSDELGELLQWL